MALRLFKRSEWESRLRQEGCSPWLDENDKQITTKSAEMWKTRHGMMFPVPADRNGYVREDDWQQVSVRIAQLKPIE